MKDNRHLQTAIKNMKKRKLRPWVINLGYVAFSAMIVADIYISMLLCYCHSWS